MLRGAAQDICAKRPDSLTPAEITTLCTYYGINVDLDTLIANGVTGVTFAHLRNESHVHVYLGVKEAGDCRRVLNIIHSMAAHAPMHEWVDITVDGETHSKWSVGQVCQWAEDHGMEAMIPALIEHKVAGDVLEGLTDAALVMMKAPLPLYGVFEAAVHELRVSNGVEVLLLPPDHHRQ